MQTAFFAWHEDVRRDSDMDYTACLQLKAASESVKITT